MKGLSLSLATAAALWSAACNGGSAGVPPPPPTGRYSLSSLQGSYAFVTNGEVFAGTTVNPLARTGSFVADGQGRIMGGVEDTLEGTNAGATPSGAVAISGGSYTVGADGRGSLTLTLGQSSINFAIVLTSTSDGLMIDETSNSNQSSTGNGNFIKQNSGSFTAPVPAITGSYVFDFSGTDASLSAESFVGEFTAGNGAISASFGDLNEGFTLSNGTFTGSFSQDSQNPTTLSNFGRGLATIAGQSYVFYIVDSRRIRFLTNSGGAMLSGDAVSQTNPPTTLNAGLAFVVAGSSGTGGLIRSGRFTANGSAVTNVLVDTNNAGQFVQSTVAAPSGASVTFDQANPGRGVVTFKVPNLGSPFSFVFYLSSATEGVIQETTQMNGLVAAVADGTIGVQTGGPFASANIAGTYAMGWSGLSIQQGGSFPTQDEEDLVAQATVSSLSLNGAGDIFQFTNGAPQTDNAVTGSVTIGGDGTGGDGQRNTTVVNLTKNGATAPVNFVVYFVNPQLALFANTSTSSTRLVAGILKAQQ